MRWRGTWAAPSAWGTQGWPPDGSIPVEAAARFVAANRLLGPARVARRRSAHHLQRQQGALAARGGDLDAELLDHPVGAELLDLLERHADQLVGRDRGRGLGDRAALAVEAQVLD